MRLELCRSPFRKAALIASAGPTRKSAQGEFTAPGSPTVADDLICRAFTADRGTGIYKRTACQLFGDDCEIREVGRVNLPETVT